MLARLNQLTIKEAKGNRNSSPCRCRYAIEAVRPRSTSPLHSRLLAAGLFTPRLTRSVARLGFRLSTPPS